MRCSSLVAGLALAAMLSPALAEPPAFIAVNPSWMPQLKQFRLDRPGALEGLRIENPAEYERVVDIVRVARDLPCEQAQALVKAKYDQLQDIRCAALILTSYPAQRDLSFILGDTMYSARLVLTAREKLYKGAH